MTCREMSEFLSEYVAGDLPVEVHVEFQGHLDRCKDCHAFMAQYRTTIELSATAFNEAPVERLPEDLVRAILAALGRA